MIQRITRGCVVEVFNGDGKCLRQIIVKGGIEYEDDRNNVIHKSKVPPAIVDAKSSQHKSLSSLSRCEFLLRRIHEGDRQALENAHEASQEAAKILSTFNEEDFDIFEH